MIGLIVAPVCISCNAVLKSSAWFEAHRQYLTGTTLTGGQAYLVKFGDFVDWEQAFVVVRNQLRDELEVTVSQSNNQYCKKEVDEILLLARCCLQHIPTIGHLESNARLCLQRVHSWDPELRRQCRSFPGSRRMRILLR